MKQGKFVGIMYFSFNHMLKTSITAYFFERNLECLVYVWYDTCMSGLLHNCNKNVAEFKLDLKKNIYMLGNIGPPKFSKILGEKKTANISYNHSITSET